LAQVFAEPAFLCPRVAKVLVHIPACNAELLLLQRPEKAPDTTEQLVQAIDPLDRRLELEVVPHVHHAGHTHGSPFVLQIIVHGINMARATLGSTTVHRKSSTLVACRIPPPAAHTRPLS